MQTTGTDETQVVIAARAGDAAALDQLVELSLPLVYSIVGRALDGHSDVDDVVQDTMVRALRDLGSLRAPERFRPWLMTIAVHQVGTSLRRRRLAAERNTTLESAAAMADPASAVEDVTLLRRDLSDQRRQVRRAAQWLDPADRIVSSLWWLELAGEVTRAELAASIGTSVAHAGVRVQRMRQQLEVSRTIVAALEATPRCPGLTGVVQGWNGAPGSVWRKRLARHVRTCPVCARTTAGLVPTERMLAGFGLLAVPVTLAAALSGKLAGLAGAAVKGSLIGQMTATVVAHPVAALIVAGTLTSGATVATVAWPDGGTTRPADAATGRTGPSLPIGRLSLESADQSGRYVAMVEGSGVLAPTGPGGDATSRKRATLVAGVGLADPKCFTLRTVDGKFVRHSSWRLRQDKDQGTALFHGDATFCVRTGSVPGTVALESSNYPGYYLRHVRGEMWVDQANGSPEFGSGSSFWVRQPLG